MTNRELMIQLRINNKNKNRILTEMVLNKKEAIVMYSLIYALSTNPKNRFKGLENLKIALSNLLMIRYKLTSPAIQKIRDEVKKGQNFYKKSKTKVAMKQDLRSMAKIKK